MYFWTLWSLSLYLVYSFPPLYQPAFPACQAGPPTEWESISVTRDSFRVFISLVCLTRSYAVVSFVLISVFFTQKTSCTLGAGCPLGLSRLNACVSSRTDGSSDSFSLRYIPRCFSIKLTDLIFLSRRRKESPLVCRHETLAKSATSPPRPPFDLSGDRRVCLDRTLCKVLGSLYSLNFTWRCLCFVLPLKGPTPEMFCACPAMCFLPSRIFLVSLVPRSILVFALFP